MGAGVVDLLESGVLDVAAMLDIVTTTRVEVLSETGVDDALLTTAVVDGIADVGCSVSDAESDADSDGSLHDAAISVNTIDIATATGHLRRDRSNDRIIIPSG